MTVYININGDVRDASSLTVPSDRTFRGAWQFNGDAVEVDMTKARIVKGAFRVLTLKLAKAGIPLLVTNHTYKQVGTMFPQDVMGGGSGLQYAASNIVFLSKRKEKV